MHLSIDSIILQNELFKVQQGSVLKIFPVLFILSVSTVSAASNESAGTYLPHINDISEITDPNRQAEAWATCAVIYDFYSDLIGSSQTKATAELLKQQRNGAKISILMSQLIALKEDSSDDEFKATYKYGQHLMEVLPSQKELQIQSDFELLSGQNKTIEHLTNKILNTYKVCQNSSRLQQTYIDLFRELAKSGLIQ